MSLKDQTSRLVGFIQRTTRTDVVYMAKNGFWINLNFGFVSIFSFILSVAFANLLSKSTFGTYQYILSISAILTAFTFSGFNTAITQSTARGYEGTFKASIRPQLLWNLLPALGGLAWSAYYFVLGQTALGLGVLFVALTLPIFNTFNSYNAYLAGKNEFRISSFYSIVGGTAYYIGIFLCVFFAPYASALIFVNLVINAGATFVLYRRTLRVVPPNERKDPEALPYARHLSIMNVLSTIAAQIDNILVFHFLGSADLALYSIATLLPERLGSAFKAIITPSLPRFANRSTEEIRSNLGIRLFLLLLSTVFAAIAYMLVAPFVFHLIYPKYDNAILYSQIYSLTFISFGAAIVTSALSAHRKIRELYVLNTIVPIAQIGILVTAVLLWGLIGLILARIISAVLLTIVSTLLIYLPSFRTKK